MSGVAAGYVGMDVSVKFGDPRSNGYESGSLCDGWTNDTREGHGNRRQKRHAGVWKATTSFCDVRLSNDRDSDWHTYTKSIALIQRTFYSSQLRSWTLYDFGVTLTSDETSRRPREKSMEWIIWYVNRTIDIKLSVAIHHFLFVHHIKASLKETNLCSASADFMRQI